MEKLKNIVFDKEDKDLFFIDDLQLKADAIRYSILPKLELVIHYAITQIDKIYNVNVFDDCSIVQSPHFKVGNRKRDVKKDYREACVSVKGKRTYNKWHGIKKPDGGEPKIAPFSLGLELLEEGLYISLINNDQLISKESHAKIFQFLSDYDSEISIIQKCARVFENRNHNPSDWLIVNNNSWFKLKLDNNDFAFPMVSDIINYPIEYKVLNKVVDRLTLLFPIFHSYLQIAMDKPVIFSELIALANDCLISDEYVRKSDHGHEEKDSNNFVNIEFAKEKAELKLRVMPGIRWQVFQRDNWRCVACGVKATDDDKVILHVDHITPRSKGGKDEIDNYQTLCDKCNIGKSNTNNTDLRKVS